MHNRFSTESNGSTKQDIEDFLRRAWKQRQFNGHEVGSSDSAVNRNAVAT